MLQKQVPGDSDPKPKPCVICLWALARRGLKRKPCSPLGSHTKTAIKQAANFLAKFKCISDPITSSKSIHTNHQEIWRFSWADFFLNKIGAVFHRVSGLGFDEHFLRQNETNGAAGLVLIQGELWLPYKEQMARFFSCLLRQPLMTVQDEQVQEELWLDRNLLGPKSREPFVHSRLFGPGLWGHHELWAWGPFVCRVWELYPRIFHDQQVPRDNQWGEDQEVAELCWESLDQKPSQFEWGCLAQGSSEPKHWPSNSWWKIRSCFDA